MTNLGKEILDFLATPSLKDGRKSLYKLLGADENEANVYYLVPLLNLCFGTIFFYLPRQPETGIMLAK